MPGCVTDLIRNFPAAVVERIEELHLSKMTKFKLKSLSYRKTCGDLRKKAIVHKDTNRIELQIRDGASLGITQKVVQHVLDLPSGSSKDFQNSKEKSTEQYNRMFKAVRFATMKYGKKKAKKQAPAVNQEQANEDVESAEQRDDDLQGSEQGDEDPQGDGEQANEAQRANEDQQHGNKLKEPEEMSLEQKRVIFTAANIATLFEHCQKDDVCPFVDNDMLVRLYLATLVDRMLLPGTSNYVTSPTIFSVHKLEKVHEIDWSYLVCEQLKKVCLDDHESPMNCCLPVFLIVLADCIEGNRLGMEESGRINLYTDAMLKDLLEDGDKKRKRGDKKKKRGGEAKILKSLEDIALIRWEDSCYGKLEIFSNLNRIDSDYKKYVLDRTRDEIVLNFGSFKIDESTFVDSFKPNGRMQSNLLHLVCNLWSRNWGDTVILGEFVVNELPNQRK